MTMQVYCLANVAQRPSSRKQAIAYQPHSASSSTLLGQCFPSLKEYFLWFDRSRAGVFLCFPTPSHPRGCVPVIVCPVVSTAGHQEALGATARVGVPPGPRLSCRRGAGGTWVGPENPPTAWVGPVRGFVPHNWFGCFVNGLSIVLHTSWNGGRV